MDYFAVDHLDSQRLLEEWRWLCPQQVRLIARSAWGDLFLSNDQGKVMKLDVHGGGLREVAASDHVFREGMRDPVLRDQWMGSLDEMSAAEKGLVPGLLQAITFALPIVFQESGYDGNAYVGDLYEAVSFLGDLHHHIHDLPQGTEVELRVKQNPEPNPSE